MRLWFRYGPRTSYIRCLVGKQCDLHSKGLGIILIKMFESGKLGGDPGDWVCMDNCK